MPTRPFATAEGWHRVVSQEAPGGLPAEPPLSAEAPTGELLVNLANLLTLANDLLAAILQELREQVQRGYVYTVTQVVTTTVPLEILFSPPLFSVALTNDGPGIVQYRIPNNASAVWINLAPTEVVNFNFIKGLVPSLALALPPAGAAATVRIVGTF